VDKDRQVVKERQETRIDRYPVPLLRRNRLIGKTDEKVETGR